MPDAKIEEKNIQPIVTFDTRDPAELLSEAKSILTNRNGPYDQAMDDLRSIILSQPPEKAREAREILGYAYEKSGNFEKAMREYNTWLGLYPEDNDDRTRVRQRLMTLEILEPTERRIGVITKTKTPNKGDSQEFNATISEYGYASSNTPGGKIAQWHTDQVSGLTGLQATWKLKHNEYNLLGRIRLSDIRDFTRPDSSKTNLSLAYLDFEDTFRGWGVKLGRQAPAAGAISKFDGLSTKFRITDNTDVFFAAGVPYIGASHKTSRRFAGAEVEYRLNNEWTISAYANRSLADGFVERMAIGGDAVYKDNNSSIILRTEYDNLYHSLNLLSFQSFKYVGHWTIFSVYDKRKSPMPFADVALGLGGLGSDKQIYNSVSEMLLKSGLSSSDIYTYVSKSSATASSAVIGATDQINKNWSLTGDLQVTNLSTIPGFNLTPQFDPVPVQIGQSNSYSVNLHLRGDDLLFKNNTSELVLNDTVGSRKSYFLTAADSYHFGDNNRNSVSLLARLDAFDQGYTKIKTVTGIFRVLYGVSKNGMLEMQYSRALTYEPLSILNSTGPYSTGQNFYIGYRYDF